MFTWICVQSCLWRLIMLSMKSAPILMQISRNGVDEKKMCNINLIQAYLLRLQKQENKICSCSDYHLYREIEAFVGGKDLAWWVLHNLDFIYIKPVSYHKKKKKIMRGGKSFPILETSSTLKFIPFFIHFIFHFSWVFCWEWF